MALGADAGEVRRMVLGQVTRMFVAGGSTGIVIAISLRIRTGVRLGNSDIQARQGPNQRIHRLKAARTDSRPHRRRAAAVHSNAVDHHSVVARGR